jgi:hypothetical protein
MEMSSEDRVLVVLLQIGAKDLTGMGEYAIWVNNPYW